MKAEMLKSAAARLAAVALLAAASLLLSSCFYMPGAGGKAQAGLVLPRYLIANPVSLALVVGGPGMEPLFASYTTIPESITIDVPSGLARTVTVLLNGQTATLQGVSRETAAAPFRLPIRAGTCGPSRQANGAIRSRTTPVPSRRDGGGHDASQPAIG